MACEDVTPDQSPMITEFTDIEAPPPNDKPCAYMIFGTNQITSPGEIVVRQYHRGLASLVIVTGGVNRHDGIIEAHEFRRYLHEQNVPDRIIRVEDRAANTFQNVENSVGYLQEASEAGLPLTIVSKWYHRRAVHILKTVIPNIAPFYAMTWEPTYDSLVVSRADWPQIPGGRRRVIREWREVSRRVSEGSFQSASIIDGSWQ